MIAARRLPELRGIGVGQHLEFEHGVDAEQHAGHRSRRLVVDVVDVGAVEQETVLLRSRAVDRDLRGAAADDVVAGRQRGAHARLQQRQLLEGTAVERQIANLVVVDEPADRAVGQVEARRLRGDRHRRLQRTDRELQIDDQGLPERELRATPRDRPEPGGGHADLVLSRRQDGHAIASPVIRRQRFRGARRDVQDDDVRARDRRAARIGDEPVQAAADRLRAEGTPAQQRRAEQQDRKSSETTHDPCVNSLRD